MVDVLNVSGLNASALSGLVQSRLVLLFGAFFLVWAIITLIFMLVKSGAKAKRGGVISVFVVSSILFLAVCVWGYLNFDKIVGWLM